MKKLLLLAFCTVTVISSEIKHIFVLKEDSINNGIYIKDSAIQKPENVYIKGNKDSEFDLIYRMANYKYGNPVSINELLTYFQRSIFHINTDNDKASYKYDNNSLTTLLRPFTLLKQIDSIDNRNNYFIINKKAEISYKVEIILNSSEKQTPIKKFLSLLSLGKKQTQGHQQIQQLIITQTENNGYYPSLSLYSIVGWSAAMGIGSFGLYMAYRKWFKK